MKGRNMQNEVFRRSGLVLTPGWCLALGVALAVGLAARYYNLESSWAELGLMMLPIVWAIGQTVAWACQTWEITTDGCLIVQEGLLLRTFLEVPLREAQQVTIEAPPLVGRLNIGHVSCLVADEWGQPQHLRWTWLSQRRHLGDVIRSQGRPIVVRPPAQYQPVQALVWRLKHIGETWWTRGQVLIEAVMTWAQGQWFVDDYGRFLGFCNYLVRAGTSEHRPPSWVPLPVANRWLEVLRQALIVVDAPNGSWRVNDAIRDVEDIRRLVGEKELRRAIRHWPTARFNYGADQTKVR